MVNTNNWTFEALAELNKERGGHAMLGVKGNMFVIGGYDGNDLKECEVFIG